jgi:hypothetical protein
MPRLFVRPATRVVPVALALAAVTLMSAVGAGASITPQTGPAGALAIAQAMASSANMTGASLPATTGGTPAATSTTVLGDFPRDGSGFGILTTGDVNAVPIPGSFANTNNGGGAVRGDTDRDVTVLKTDFTVPTGANCLTVDSSSFPRSIRSTSAPSTTTHSSRNSTTRPGRRAGRRSAHRTTSLSIVRTTSSASTRPVSAGCPAPPGRAQRLMES